MSRPSPSRKPGGAASTGRGAAVHPVPAVAVVISRYNASVTGKLLDGAVAAYAAAGGDPASVTVVEAPGSYELVSLSNAAARSGRFAAVVALGCIIRGDTDHDRYIASAVAHGLAQVSVETGIPVAFGVLTVNTPRQARERAGGVHGNKGAEAMGAALHTVREIARLESGATPHRRSTTLLPDKAARGLSAKRNGVPPKPAAAKGAR
jgi:6,7-dimethyl-8-ribityllumazine synthase